LFFLFFSAKINNMNGLTVNEIGEKLGIHPKAAKTRLIRKGIKPIGYAGPTALYDESVVDAIREVNKGGRPRKDKSE
jgi:hypothetical protein